MSRDQARSRRLLLLLPAGVLLVAVLGYAAILLASRSMSSDLLGKAEIAVLDPSGRPIAGVPIVAEWDELPFHRGRSLGVTDPGGRVSLRELRGEWAMFGEFELHALLTGSTQETFRLEERTRIVLPEVGALRLRLVDESGAPFAMPLGSAMAYLQGTGRAGSAAFGRDGVATFDRVACASGMRLEVRLHSFTPRLPDGDATPTTAEGRTIDLVVPSATPRLLGRVVDAAGNRLQDSFRMRLQCGGMRLLGPVITTSSDGSFVYLLDDLHGSGTLTLQHATLGEAVVPLREGDGRIRDLGTIAFPGR